MNELKQEAARQGCTMSELVERALRSLLHERPPARKLPPLPEFDTGEARVDVADRDALYGIMGRVTPFVADANVLIWRNEADSIRRTKPRACRTHPSTAQGRHLWQRRQRSGPISLQGVWQHETSGSLGVAGRDEYGSVRVCRECKGEPLKEFITSHVEKIKPLGEAGEPGLVGRRRDGRPQGV